MPPHAESVFPTHVPPIPQDQVERSRTLSISHGIKHGIPSNPEQITDSCAWLHRIHPCIWRATLPQKSIKRGLRHMQSVCHNFNGSLAPENRGKCRNALHTGERLRKKDEWIRLTRVSSNEGCELSSEAVLLFCLHLSKAADFEFSQLKTCAALFLFVVAMHLVMDVKRIVSAYELHARHSFATPQDVFCLLDGGTHAVRQLTGVATSHWNHWMLLLRLCPNRWKRLHLLVLSRWRSESLSTIWGSLCRWPCAHQINKNIFGISKMLPPLQFAKTCERLLNVSEIFRRRSLTTATMRRLTSTCRTI